MEVKIIKCVGQAEIQKIITGEYEEVLAVLSEMGELEEIRYEQSTASKDQSCP